MAASEERLPTSGALADGVHVYPIRVYYEDTDAAGIVYHANYLRFAERARTEFLRLAGASHSTMRADAGTAFAVRHCTIDYLAPARLDDAIEVRTRLLELAGASMSVEQIVRRGETDLARLRLRIACIGPGGRPTRVPQDVRAGLAALGLTNTASMSKDDRRRRSPSPFTVITRLVRMIHDLRLRRAKSWMARTSRAMTPRTSKRVTRWPQLKVIEGWTRMRRCSVGSE